MFLTFRKFPTNVNPQIRTHMPPQYNGDMVKIKYQPISC